MLNYIDNRTCIVGFWIPKCIIMMLFLMKIVIILLGFYFYKILNC